MKTRSTLFLLFSAALLSLTACFSPRPVVRIEPTDPADKWNYGQAILEAEQDDVIASASYAFSDRDYHVFDLEVTNWRQDRILVDPAGIELVLPGGERRLSAIDPEDQLFNMEVYASRREASAKNAALVAGVVAVAAVTAAIISDNNDGGNEANNVVNDNAVGDVVNIAPTLLSAPGVEAAPNRLQLK